VHTQKLIIHGTRQEPEPLARGVENTDEEGTTFHWESFPGAEDGEHIEVAVRPDVIHSVECLKLGKHAKGQASLLPRHLDAHSMGGQGLAERRCGRALGNPHVDL